MKILSRPKKNAEEYGKWAVNAYIGCSNRCRYCYLNQGPSAGYLGQPQAVLKKGVVSPEHAYHLAMAEIIEHKDEIIRDGGLFFTFTSDPCLPETRRLTFRIVSACIGNKATPKEQVIPVTLLTKNADFCAWGPPTPDSCGMMIPPYDWVNNIGYHIIWCPKYRRKLLQWGIDERLKILLVEKATRMGCRIEQMEVMPDHVHIFIKTPPTLAIDALVQGLKGYTSYVLRRERPWLQKIKTLWSPSYYVESIGHISEETVRRYIEDQKETAQRKAGSLSSHG